jgi:hypothetical protein
MARTFAQDVVADWKKLHTEVLAVEECFEDEDFRSLCVGWCLSRGMDTETAYAFYEAMITAGFF